MKFTLSLRQSFSTTKYDIAIIGGGSGGLAFALEGAKLGLNMVVFDYVTPSPQGTTWGLGGTCVNVGCIPKKLMHTSALIREQNESSGLYGWNQEHQKQVNWQQLASSVQDYIKGLNYGYKQQLKQVGVTYLNKMAAFKDSNHIVYGSHEQVEKALSTRDFSELDSIQFKYSVVSVGGRPTQLDSIKQYAISSDDIFWKESPPGKTLVIGGGYVAMECAGFLDRLGYDVTMMTRSKYLREFDQGMAQELLNYYQHNTHVRIVPESLPFESKLLSNNKIHVKWANTKNRDIIGEDEFDTILMAVGRSGNSKWLNLESVGVQVNPNNQKIIPTLREETHNPNIFAIGDINQNVPELTPVASKQGQLLARRLSRQLKNQPSDEDNIMDLNDYPTAVFTPLEYGCVGLSEEKAIELYKEENIEVYHSKFVPLEEQLCNRMNADFELLQKKVYCKVIVRMDTCQVVGMHYLGPHAGEIIQGFAAAIKVGITFKQLQRTVGIHPTCAEEFVLLKTTKRSGEDYEKHGC